MNSGNMSSCAFSTEGGWGLTLDVGNFFLLLGIGLHLIGLVFTLCSDVSGVITTIVLELLVYGQIDNVGTNFVHEIGRVAKVLADEEVTIRATYDVKIKIWL